MNLNMRERLFGLNDASICMPITAEQFHKAYVTASEMLKNAYKRENGAGEITYVRMTVWPSIRVQITTNNAKYNLLIHYRPKKYDLFQIGTIKANDVRNRKTMYAEKQQIFNALNSVLKNY